MPQTPEQAQQNAGRILDDLIKVFNKHSPTIEELCLAYGNLGVHLGASVGGLSKIPDLETLKQRYYAAKDGNPPIDISLMLQGFTTTAWAESIREGKSYISDLSEKENT